jgi:hypothetical protein
VSDGYLNPVEHATSAASVTNLVGTNYDTAKYAVVPSLTTCGASVTYGASIPTADDTAISSDGATYKVCVELSDSAGNPKAYGASATVVYRVRQLRHSLHFLSQTMLLMATST